MNLSWIALGVCVVFWAAYRTYGRYLAKHFELDDERPTPAVLKNDGVDFEPAGKGFLLGQHFSAIAAAGPIVGPILGALWFGWLPVLLWIVLGSIFFGAMHDFASLAGSVRHGASSVVEMMRVHLGRRGHVLFLAFVWLSLLYVITAFTDLTSASFTEPELGGGVATASTLYLVLGVVMGLALKVLRMPLKWATPFFLALVVLAIAYGPSLPLRLPSTPLGDPQKTWNVVLLVYCLAASLAPVWVLLQPRGYLGGFFLYVTLAAGVVGLFLGGETVQYPAFIGWTSPHGMPLFPVLFVTVACGACSGFHGIVCSGTTSKQVSKESHCHTVGYGAMLLEGLVAVVALATVMILSRGDVGSGASPDRVYAEGLSRFVSHFGVPRDYARTFALLAFTTFIYDTLDVTTRLARYVLQELLGWKGDKGRVTATLLSLGLPLFCVSLRLTGADGSVLPAWKVFWTLFGTSNQLLAALTLMMLALWLKRTGKRWQLAAVPMAFMLVMTLWSLGRLIWTAISRWLAGGPVPDTVAVVAMLLMTLSVLLLVEAAVRLRRGAPQAP
ncbi:MAG: Peptide transporter CstA [Candidatus Omnitrophica bacterium]|nr:Peptide transporter CstA [Candidatus Omnitrophota bacterium]